MRAMILAAGRGERMRPLTDRKPKVMLSVGGKPLLVWHLEKLVRAGCNPIVINHAWLGEQIESELGDGSRYGAELLYSRETQALETAGGIATAMPLLGDAPFMVVNGDVFCDLDFAALLPHAATLDGEATLAHLLLVDNPPHHPNGDFALERGRVTSTGEPRLTFSGIALYHPKLFAEVAPNTKSPLAPLLRSSMSRGVIGGEQYTGLWLDIGTPERLAALDRSLASRQ